jgi:hypothetical protein
MAAFLVADSEPPSGAMAEKRDTSHPGIIQQMESTGRECSTWRAHLGQNRSRGRTKEGARLREAAARAHAHGDRSLEHHSSFERMRWMRRGAAPGLYSPRAVPRKEGEDLGRGFGRWGFWEGNPTPTWGGRRF